MKRIRSFRFGIFIPVMLLVAMLCTACFVRKFAVPEARERPADDSTLIQRLAGRADPAMGAS